MSGGLYVYRLQAEDVRISRTMLLVPWGTFKDGRLRERNQGPAPGALV